MVTVGHEKTASPVANVKPQIARRSEGEFVGAIAVKSYAWNEIQISKPHTLEIDVESICR